MALTSLPISIFSQSQFSLRTEKGRNRDHSQTKFSEDIQDLQRPTHSQLRRSNGRCPGCIPNYEVNFFSRLCKPAVRPSVVPSHEAELQDAINRQVDHTAAPRTSATLIFEHGSIATALRKNGRLIRGFSGGIIEIYRTTIETMWAEARRDSMNAVVVESAQEKQPEEHDQVAQIDINEAKYYDHRHTGQQ